MIYPSSPYEGGCWDVSSEAALTNNGGGDSNSIANMVTYTLEQYNGDASRVFVTGSSSGGMMTNVMAATYPELFQAATTYSGVPAGCFADLAGGEAVWNSQCALGQIDETPEYWANIAEEMYPDYSGSRPRIQVYHGSNDGILLPQNYNETIKQWTGVFGYDYSSPDSSDPDTPASGYTTDTWGITEENPRGTVQGIYAVGAGHTLYIDGYVRCSASLVDVC